MSKIFKTEASGMIQCLHCDMEIDECDICSGKIVRGDVIYCDYSEDDESKHLCKKCFIERSEIND